MDYNFDCKTPKVSSISISAFPAVTTVRNLSYPCEEYVLEASTIKCGIENSGEFNGFLSQLKMLPWEWKVLVPIEKWEQPSPTITRFLPGHDIRLRSTGAYDEQESIPIQIRFSVELGCGSVTNTIIIESRALQGETARLNGSSIDYAAANTDFPQHVGEVATT